jgi:hypothetical protein
MLFTTSCVKERIDRRSDFLQILQNMVRILFQKSEGTKRRSVLNRYDPSPYIVTQGIECFYLLYCTSITGQISNKDSDENLTTDERQTRISFFAGIEKG